MSMTRPLPSFHSPVQLHISPSATSRNLSLLPPLPPSVSPRRLHAYVASSGRYFELSVGATDTVAALKEGLVAVTHIPHADQVILTDDGTELDARHTVHQSLAHLSPPTPTHAQADATVRIFVFNRTDGLPSRRPPRVPSPPHVELRLPTNAEVKCPDRRVVLQSSNLLTRTLPEYEHHFRKHVLEASAHMDCIDYILRQASTQRAELEAMLAALDAALANLERYARHTRRNLDSFQSNFGNTSREHHALLDSWSKDLERLKEVEVTGRMRRYVGALLQTPSPISDNSTSPVASPIALTPASPVLGGVGFASSSTTGGSSRITLYDVLAPSLPHLTRHFDQIAHDQSTLDRKAEEMASTYTRIDTDVKGLAGAHRTAAILAPLQHLADAIRPDASNPHGVETIMVAFKQLQQDYNEVVEYVDKLESSLRARPGESSQFLDLPMPPATAATRFDQVHTRHAESVMPQFARALAFYREELMPSLAQCTAAVHQAFFDVHARISAASKALRGLQHTLPLYPAALERVASMVRASLLPVHQMPSAWAATLVEVPRRKAFRRAFQQEAQAMADRIHKLAADECTRRDAFQRDHAAYIPKGHSLAGPNGRPSWTGGFGSLSAQLLERPPLLDLSFTDFDTALPDLDSTGNTALAAGTVPTSPISMPRSSSSHSLAMPALPVIDESVGSDGSGSSSSLTPLTSALVSITALSSIQTAFPWMAVLEARSHEAADAQARVAALEKEVQTLKEQLAAKAIAATFAPNVKPISRRGSGSNADGASTASPPQTTRGMSDAAWRTKYDALERLYAECQSNAVSLETRLQQAEGERGLRAKLVASAQDAEKVRAALEKDLASERAQNAEMSANSARVLFMLNEKTRELDAAHGSHAEERENYEVLLSVNSRKLALANFAVPDIVLFHRDPRRPDDIDRLKVFALGEQNYFISPESAQRYKHILLARQSRADAAIAQAVAREPPSRQARQDDGDAASAAVAPSAPPAPHAPPSSSPSAVASPPTAARPLPFGELMGEIVEVSRYVAEEHHNPFDLPIGTEFHTVTVLIPDESNDDDDEEEEKKN